MGLLEILKRRTPVWPWSPDHSPIFSEVAMLARPTLTRPVRGDASKPKTQTRPTEKRFLLRVDGQIKRSFSSKEDAATARAVIKKVYPVVVVTVVDTDEHTTEIIKA